MRMTRFLTLVPLLAAALCFADPEPPSDDSVSRFVKGKIPEHLAFKYVEIKTRKVTEKEAVFTGKLTGTISAHLFKDVTTELLPELASPSEIPAGLTPPVIIKKVHGSGEIVEIPVEIRFQKQDGRWEGDSLDDKGQIENLGKPQASHKLGALAYGSSQADRAVTQFRKDWSKASAGGKRVESAATATSARDGADAKAEEPTDEAEKPVVKKTLTRKEKLDALVAIAGAGKSYKGLLPGPNGLGAATLRFATNDHDGAEVTAEIVDSKDQFNRRTLTGRIRENPDIPSQWELYLVGVEVPKTRATGSNAAAPVVKKTYLVLTLDDEGNLVGDSSTSRGTPLTKQKMEKKDYALSFSP